MIEAPELLSFLRHEETRAKNTALDGDRAALISFYRGEPYGDEEDGRSQLVSRDVAEVIDHMTVSVLRTMVSGDKVVEFEDNDHEGENDGDADAGEEQPGTPKRNPIGYAQQATEAIHWYFMRKGRGYTVLHDSLKAGLLEKTGWVKAYPEQPEPKRETLEVPAELLHQVEPIEAEPVDPNNEYGTWRVTVPKPQPVKFCAEAVPNEEMLVAPDARDLRNIVYIAHRTPKTLSQLREMGLEADGLSDDSAGWEDDTLSNARDVESTWFHQNEVDRQGANRRVWLLEEYVRFDMNGDGRTELLQIHRVGMTILSIEEVDEHPFEYWTPFPMQHRLVGDALADKVADIQRTNSVLLRNAMDSLYIGLAPRTMVSESAIGENTIEDLLTVRPSGIVRFKGPVPPETIKNQDTSATAFQAIEFMIGQRESRTGITRLNQGLDADTLNKTATGTALMQAQGQQIEEYVARNFAEMCVAPLFAKFYRMMRAHGSPFRMKIDGQVVEIDPRQWPEEIDINIRVGLGSGRKDQRIMYRMQMLEIQKEAVAAGLPTVTAEHIYNSVRGLVEDTGLGDPNDYMADPATIPPQEPKPDPEMAKAQADAQVQQGKLQLEQQKAQAQIELQNQTNAAQIDAMREKHALDLQLQREKAQAEVEMNQERLNREYALEMQKLAIQREVGLAGAKAKAEDTNIPANRDGGSLAE